MGVHKQILSNSFTKFEPLFSGNGFFCNIYAKGTVICNSDLLQHRVYYVKEGGIRVNIISENGKEVTITRAPKGAMFPLSCFGFNTGSFTVEYILRAGFDTKTIEFSGDRLRELFLSDAEFALACFQYKCKEENLYLYQLASHTTCDARRKVCEALRDLSAMSAEETEQNAYTLHRSQDEIASVMGLSRVQISRVLQSLREEGVIDTQNKKIVILNAEKLREMCM